MRSSNIFPLVEIEWYDSMSFRDTYWGKAKTILDTIRKLKPIKTTGYLLTCTKHHILIAQTMYIDMDEHKYIFGGYFIIPIGAIVNINYVKRERKKKNTR